MISVLVIDDDFMVAKVHSGFVARTEGFEVCGIAHSGAEGLELASELQPDLALLDVHLPGTSGLDLIAPLREVAPDLDILVITSEREAASVKRALRSGVIHYLIKPFSYETLRERLEHYQRVYGQLNERTQADQDDVDQVFGIAGSSTTLPKGLSAETLRLVEDLLRGCQTDLSANEAATQLGLSRVSARRYLEFLAGRGKVRARLKYGEVGRPERRYQWHAAR
ncbi:response regulator [Nocardia cyriacigeorgica]|uniref:Transcriptional regulatory protein n=1 Tax=Nocardia cyriacigeorgica TaxID=135487 RepID=A0ABX0CES5_9NOCA|nr:response regulator [Nocardia cyriacigeorgica]NEW55073.1 response regulator [Nocardia cyriacigeorgica]